jgi:hypothetical protein
MHRQLYTRESDCLSRDVGSVACCEARVHKSSRPEVTAVHHRPPISLSEECPWVAHSSLEYEGCAERARVGGRRRQGFLSQLSSVRLITVTRDHGLQSRVTTEVTVWGSQTSTGRRCRTRRKVWQSPPTTSVKRPDSRS